MQYIYIEVIILLHRGLKDKILANQVSQAHECCLVVLTMSPLFDLLFWADREEDGLFADDDEEEEAQLGVPKQFYYDEYDDPYDILKMMMNYVDNDAGTCLHLATKVSWWRLHPEPTVSKLQSCIFALHKGSS